MPHHQSLDGVSLLPHFEQSGTISPRALYFHYPNYAFHRDNRLGGAIRKGDYKLIKNYDDDSVELYNLAQDIGEQIDLSSKKPEIAQGMKTELEQWLLDSGAKMPKPIKVVKDPKEEI